MTRKFRIGCDMDGCIADFCGLSVKVIEKEWEAPFRVRPMETGCFHREVPFMYNILN